MPSDDAEVLVPVDPFEDEPVTCPRCGTELHRSDFDLPPIPETESVISSPDAVVARVLGQETVVRTFRRHDDPNDLVRAARIAFDGVMVHECGTWPTPSD